MGSASFPRAARLLRPGDFAALRRASRRVGADHFHAEAAPHASGPRLGMAVSRRVSKRAVERNRIKRQIRDSYRHVRPQLPALDILVVARTSAATHDNATLRADLIRLWDKLRRLAAAAPGSARVEAPPRERHNGEVPAASGRTTTPPSPSSE